MRALPACLLLLLLAACQSEPTFDERYADTEQSIADKADELDEDLESKPAAPAEADNEG